MLWQLLNSHAVTLSKELVASCGRVGPASVMGKACQHVCADVFTCRFQTLLLCDVSLKALVSL